MLDSYNVSWLLSSGELGGEYSCVCVCMYVCVCVSVCHFCWILRNEAKSDYWFAQDQRKYATGKNVLWNSADGSAMSRLFSVQVTRGGHVINIPTLVAYYDITLSL
jgi:hypothetical protein